MNRARTISLLIFIASPALWASSEACRPGALKLLTGSSTGYYHRLGQAIQQVANSKGFNICAQEIDQTIDSITKLDAGAADFALVQSDVAHDAWFGHGPTFKTSLTVRLVMPLYVEAVHVLVRPHLNISSLADLRGRRVWLGRDRSATEFTAKRVLAAAGLEVDGNGANKVESVTASGYCDAVDRLRRTDGTLDAMFRVTLVPAADIQDALERAPQPGKTQENPCVGASEIRLFSLDLELVERLVQDGSYVEALIPGAAYHLNRSILTVGVQALLLTNRPDDDTAVQALAHLVRTERSVIQKLMAASVGKAHHHHHHHMNVIPKLSLVNVATPEALLPFVHPRARGDLYEYWRDSWMPLLPFMLLPLIVASLFFLRMRVVLRHILVRQPKLTFAIAGTLLFWFVGTGILYHFEWRVNEYYNSFPRSLESTFLYFASFPDCDLVTQAGRSAGQMTKWISLVVFGGFAVPLLKQALDATGRYLLTWLEREQTTPARSVAPTQKPGFVAESGGTSSEAA
jgi:TRAP transporter TAXI family solute receptor